MSIGLRCINQIAALLRLQEGCLTMALGILVDLRECHWTALPGGFEQSKATDREGVTSLLTAAKNLLD